MSKIQVLVNVPLEGTFEVEGELNGLHPLILNPKLVSILILKYTIDFFVLS